MLKYWKPLLFGVFILFLCLLPSESIQKMDFLKIKFQDLGVHLVLFFVLALLLTMDFRKYKSLQNNRIRQIYTVLIIGVVFAIFTELAQYIFRSLHRDPNFGDLVFDVTGCVLGMITGRTIKI